MLPRYMKFWIHNHTGVALPFDTGGNTFTINAQMWKRSRGNKIYRSSTIVLFPTPTAALADTNAVVASNTVGNNTDYEGLHAVCSLVTTASAPGAGTLDIYYEYSVDGSVFPSDSAEFVVTNLTKLAEVVIATGGESRPAQFTL